MLAQTTAVNYGGNEWCDLMLCTNKSTTRTMGNVKVTVLTNA